MQFYFRQEKEAVKVKVVDGRTSAGAGPIGAKLSVEATARVASDSIKAPSVGWGSRIETMELAYASGRRLSLATRAHPHGRSYPRLAPGALCFRSLRELLLQRL